MIAGLSLNELRSLTRLNVGASAFSLCGSVFIILCYLFFKELRRFSFRLVLFLSISDAFVSFFNLFGDPGGNMLCFLQGMLTQFFSVASFLWTTTIMYTLHRTVVRHKADVEELEPTYHLYVWATSFVMTVIPIIGNDYGHAGAWCGVENGTLFGKILRFITFYLPLWGAILFNGVGYFQVIRTLGHTMKMAQSMSDRKQQMEVRINSKAVNRLSYYPLILIASWAFATINKVYDFIRPTHPIFWLYCAHVATASLMGLFNSIAYGLNSTVRRTLRERILEHLPDKYKRFWVSEWLTSPPTAFIQLENIYLDDSFAISGRDSAASDQSQL